MELELKWVVTKEKDDEEPTVIKRYAAETADIKCNVIVKGTKKSMANISDTLKIEL